MRFTLVSLVALFATALAVPADQATQELCIGLNDRMCSNGTMNYKCCPPLVCGSDAVCFPSFLSYTFFSSSEDA